MKKRIYIFVALWLAAIAAPGLAGASDILSIAAAKSQETVLISLPETQPYKVFTLANPDRLVVDVPLVPGKPTVTLPSSYKGTLIKSVRFAAFNPETSRFVFDLAAPINIAEKTQAKGQITVVISGAGKPAAKAEPVPKKAKKPEKPMIVIDAGHGGVDPGTDGPKGTLEKEIVLEYAKALKARLLKTGRYRVMLTREDDRFIMLRKRVDIARKAGGVIFISLHADSAPDLAARGLSVYTVSEKASDMEAEALAARENKSDVIAGMDLSTEREDVADILISLAQRETKNSSATLADLLVTNLGDRVKLLENTHRFAGFAVLKAPDIPSVLVEIGFLSHPAEEKLLKTKAHRDKVTAGIAAGLDAYFVLQKMGEGQ